jgi:hypothetical protein
MASFLRCGFLLAFGLLAFSPVHAGVVIGPWLEGDTTTNVDVLVECDAPTPLTLNYGLSTNYGASAATSVCWTNARSAADFIHRIKLTGLQTNQVYHFQLAGQGAAPTDFDFATMPPTNLVAGITLAEAPTAVRNAVMAVAGGRAVEKVNRVNRYEGPQFYVYIADALGPQLLTLNTNCEVLINARVVPFADLSPTLQSAVRTAVAGQLQVCRQATQTASPFVVPNSQSPYIVDYLLNGDEPVFALLRETDGWVRASYGYYEDDPD